MISARPDRAARARIAAWPDDPDVVQLSVVDHRMVPDRADVEHWLRAASSAGASTVRTSALFPDTAVEFERAGFVTVGALVLFRADLTASPPHQCATRGRASLGSDVRVRRARRRDLIGAAEVDRRAFAGSWTNDDEGLAAIQRATPHHRSRIIGQGSRIDAFAISGRSGDAGYLQRLAVDPRVRGRGLGRRLVDDALAWMRRRSVHSALVNTSTDNDAAISLYRSSGFEPLAEPLRIMERALTA